MCTLIFGDKYECLEEIDRNRNINLNVGLTLEHLLHNDS